MLATQTSTLLSDANSKAQLFLDRYVTVLHRTQRNFKNKLAEHDKLTLQTVDFLLTLSYKTLDKTLILGSLIQATEGKYYLEDPTGLVQLDLTHARYFFKKSYNLEMIFESRFKILDIMAASLLRILLY